MKSRRPLLLVVLFTGSLVLGAGAWVLWPRPSAITVENAEKIRTGMSLAEVETLLGGPPRDETTAAGPLDSKSGRRHRIERNPHYLPKDAVMTWSSNTVVLCISANASGEITQCECRIFSFNPESRINMIRRRLHL